MIRYRATWCAMPNDLPPWWAVYQQSRRWMEAGCFDALVSDLRAVLRIASGRRAEPTAAILDSRTLHWTPENDPRAGYDRTSRKKGSNLHIAVDTLGYLSILHVTPASRDDRAGGGRLAATIQDATDKSFELAYVDQGYTGETCQGSTGPRGGLEVVRLPEAKRGFVLLPRRWVVERSFA
nr:transposase [Komagataeibacter kakiaceti]